MIIDKFHFLELGKSEFVIFIGTLSWHRLRKVESIQLNNRNAKAKPVTPAKKEKKSNSQNKNAIIKARMPQ